MSSGISHPHPSQLSIWFQGHLVCTFSSYEGTLLCALSVTSMWNRTQRRRPVKAHRKYSLVIFILHNLNICTFAKTDPTLDKISWNLLKKQRVLYKLQKHLNFVVIFNGYVRTQNLGVWGNSRKAINKNLQSCLKTLRQWEACSTWPAPPVTCDTRKATSSLALPETAILALSAWGFPCDCGNGHSGVPKASHREHWP